MSTYFFLVLNLLFVKKVLKEIKEFKGQIEKSKMISLKLQFGREKVTNFMNLTISIGAPIYTIFLYWKVTLSSALLFSLRKPKVFVSQILPHHLTKEGCVRKSFYCLVRIKEPCVRKFEAVILSKILLILQTVLYDGLEGSQFSFIFLLHTFILSESTVLIFDSTVLVFVPQFYLLTPQFYFLFPSFIF